MLIYKISLLMKLHDDPEHHLYLLPHCHKDADLSFADSVASREKCLKPRLYIRKESYARNEMRGVQPKPLTALGYLL